MIKNVGPWPDHATASRIPARAPTLRRHGRRCARRNADDAHVRRGTGINGGARVAEREIAEQSQTATGPCNGVPLPRPRRASSCVVGIAEQNTSVLGRVRRDGVVERPPPAGHVWLEFSFRATPLP